MLTSTCKLQTKIKMYKCGYFNISLRERERERERER